MQRVTFALIVAALVSGGCGGNLGDSERLWCTTNPLSVNEAHLLSGPSLDPSLDPALVAEAMSAPLAPGWEDLPDYVQACKTAYASR